MDPITAAIVAALAAGVASDATDVDKKDIVVADRLAEWRGYPQQLRMDNGPELISQVLADWAAEHEVKLTHIQPGKPAQNAFIERYNRTYREPVLDAYLELLNCTLSV